MYFKTPQPPPPQKTPEPEMTLQKTPEQKQQQLLHSVYAIVPSKRRHFE